MSRPSGKWDVRLAGEGCQPCVECGDLRTGTLGYVRVGEMVGREGGSPPECTMVGRLFRTGRVLRCPRMLIARISQGKIRMKVITW